MADVTAKRRLIPRHLPTSILRTMASPSSQRMPAPSSKNLTLPDLAPKFYPVLSSLQRFLVAVVGLVAAGCGAEPFRLRSTAAGHNDS
ncbi:hypothetical protein ELH51_07890 [Rhizobium ruizarguesonis]|nr:hypothetical protein ELH74_12130 [Rhizobium ruizarguesonis]TBB21658.1 hypothetical protein ELH51_07890 [Rhizobium ruizarguesonis]